MYKLLILKCDDKMRWYSNKIGEYVQYKGKVKEPDEYRSIDDGGYVNFVQIQDAALEWVAEYDNS